MGCHNCVNSKNEQITELITAKSIPKNIIKKNKINELKKEILYLINEKRKEYKVEPLTENKEITNIAQKYAEEISQTEILTNSNNQYKGEDLGESIFCYSTILDANGLINRLCKKESNYDNNNNQEIPSHFTQMIWKNSTLIGIGINRNISTGHMVFVLNYYPSGNISEKFKENIIKKFPH